MNETNRFGQVFAYSLTTQSGYLMKGPDIL